MKVTRFDPPGLVDDLSGNDHLLQQWSDHVSRDFDIVVASIKSFIQKHSRGTPQLYNPLTHGLTDPDTILPIPWNGFPKRFTSPGQDSDYASAEPPKQPIGQPREQDEYLEWFAVRNDAGKIVKVQFTCEAWDYWEFLARVAPDTVVSLYKKFINPPVSEDQLRKDLFPGGRYDRLNRWNTQNGAMHLTNEANNLFAELKLAGDATVRRKSHGSEPSNSADLIACGQYGDPARDSDPTIGFNVNGEARKGAMLTLVNPVGLYIASCKLDGLTYQLNGPSGPLDGQPATNCFQIVRGQADRIVRAEFSVPQDAADKGYTVSDILIDGVPIEFGGQLAELVTMHLFGAACRYGKVYKSLQPCGGIPQVNPPAPHFGIAAIGFTPRPGRAG